MYVYMYIASGGFRAGWVFPFPLGTDIGLSGVNGRKVRSLGGNTPSRPASERAARRPVASEASLLVAPFSGLLFVSSPKPCQSIFGG